MNSFRVIILGAGSAVPTLHRAASSQLLQYNSTYILIDCAEGTQLQLKKRKISPMRINHILISHLHGDHYFGLIGLISSLHLIGRTQPLQIFGPPQLSDILQLQLKASDTNLRFSLLFKPLSEAPLQQILNDEQLEIFAFPVLHRIPTWGFLIREKIQELNILHEFIEAYHPDIESIHAIKKGADFYDQNGTVIKNHEITRPQPRIRSYAYCTDTAYHEPNIEIISGANLLYHEATFMGGLSREARMTFHSTTLDAAEIAKKAGVNKLLLGHFSSRYNDLEPLLIEARQIFSNTELAIDGDVFEIE